MKKKIHKNKKHNHKNKNNNYKNKIINHNDENYNMFNIRESLIPNAGKGVFTTKNYKKGNYVCFYDGIKKEINNSQDFTYSIIDPNDNKTLVGYFDKIRNKYGVGQFINDFCMFS